MPLGAICPRENPNPPRVGTVAMVLSARRWDIRLRSRCRLFVIFGGGGGGGVIRVFAENLVGLSFLSPVSYIKPKSQPTKNYLLWEKVAQMPLLTYFFLGWVSLGSGSL